MGKWKGGMFWRSRRMLTSEHLHRHAWHSWHVASWKCTTINTHLFFVQFQKTPSNVGWTGKKLSVIAAKNILACCPGCEICPFVLTMSVTTLWIEKKDRAWVPLGQRVEKMTINSMENNHQNIMGKQSKTEKVVSQKTKSMIQIFCHCFVMCSATGHDIGTVCCRWWLGVAVVVMVLWLIVVVPPVQCWPPFLVVFFDVAIL